MFSDEYPKIRRLHMALIDTYAIRNSKKYITVSFTHILRELSRLIGYLSNKLFF